MSDRHAVQAHSRTLRGAALLLLLPAAACGNLTAGGFGEAHVVASGNYEPQPAPSPAPAPMAAAGSPVAPAPQGADEADQAEGEVEAEFSVFLVSETGAAHQVGDDDLRVRVDIQGRQELESDSALIQAIRYTSLRLVFTEIYAEVDSGLVINGIPIVGDLYVELEDTNLVVERPIDLTVVEGQQVDLVVDLNAPSWLASVDPITRTITESVFAALVNVVVR